MNKSKPLFTNLSKLAEIKTNRNTSHYFIINGEVKPVMVKHSNTFYETVARASMALNAQTKG